jgi:hypothetical protein
MSPTGVLPRNFDDRRPMGNSGGRYDVKSDFDLTYTQVD